uniref:Uncharacterized protein n=1 Tax=Chromera velia CCMP2878 TaxID=1169474 RepID=A0A0G4G4R7_9ALVE|mmetsp:Transcript_5110/g.10178  ORF Transcript_5110/g.10178 Transcript_5110/m.10178 type:complete len:257 (-) Transcript_5110:168-938(-)|eukprot:Cvel_568.t1-p1 / transcript=Cvel_568.t1 / gene=Cvel_568 / organism=Chromera_velia_CCMP2878 / gene_product=hypothetical protein / transcript_product=hypothetical protein / location=Cvel_scaffold17:179364-180131(+) / protein_length=256 / sequence_SO=supercontig / SO=protein_coding / is_pseudo=false
MSIAVKNISSRISENVATISSALFGGRTGKLYPSLPDVRKGITFKPYTDGLTAAHHYPNTLLPVDLSSRFPSEFPVYACDRSRYFGKHVLGDIREKCLLDQRLFGRVSAVVFTRGTAHSSLEHARRWEHALRDQIERADAERKQLQLLHVVTSTPISSLLLTGHVISMQSLIKSTFGGPEGTNFLAAKKISPEHTRTLCLYNEALPTVLLVDRHCRIRWHCIGLQTEEAAEIARLGLRALSRERGTFFRPAVSAIR